MHETIQELMADLGVQPGYTTATLEQLGAADSKYLRDLKLNVKSVLTSESLSAKESYLLALAIATNNNNTVLQAAFTAKAKENEASDAEIAEAQACASLLAANNVFYRFRHFVDKEFYNNAPAKLRMNIMMNPVLGKEFFELVSLAVSAVNGCEMCVKSHEQSVLHAGSSEQRVWDAIRLASIITSLSKMVY
ncbi:MAG TPA: carboxymuconolactone decarboxylase family protein [Chitinophagales bacterium]|jgi:alkyl hydroperoxide reductase subunit D|nr:carboxymuconolactone decarboxylase family protein [Chitinophagales bacterium]HPA36531.1 carboxymuconolactone decarboxylase family protein [Chitinophagales bacterium]HQD11371.1 carboxymuconolactone decarboxylase family protein [Chitinophagales bacterium]HQO31995.1 carboxymuconolactone decarboxylase family protein [Chitinophagales bacterium]HQO89521.1 carboxymuconolactone decarboxylase family protein [Chitinophagales bacterium]